ncbi:MAG TPA: YciI family protein [Actinomycetota bacterium]|nr:YciI family protein [Actinomycetota bacterium]
MKFALLIYGDESEWATADEARQKQMYEAHAAFGAWLDETGWSLGGEELGPSSRAATVRTGEDGTVVSDGPFAETKEQLGGLYLIECGSREEAIEAAKRLPARIVEVRPIVEADERPS